MNNELQILFGSKEIDKVFLNVMALSAGGYMEGWGSRFTGGCHFIGGTWTLCWVSGVSEVCRRYCGKIWMVKMSMTMLL